MAKEISHQERLNKKLAEEPAISEKFIRECYRSGGCDPDDFADFQGVPHALVRDLASHYQGEGLIYKSTRKWYATRKGQLWVHALDEKEHLEYWNSNDRPKLLWLIAFLIAVALGVILYNLSCS